MRSKQWFMILVFIVSFFVIPQITRAAVASNPLSKINYWVYQIQKQDENNSIQKLVESPYELVVIDEMRTIKGNESYDNRADVTLLKHSLSRSGRAKIVLSYLDVGEAESFRTYWQDGWKSGSPDWIVAPDPDGWRDNYPVKFWRPAWKDQLKPMLNAIISDGYDGIYLDWLEAYSFDKVAKAAELEGRDPAKELINFTSWIAHYTRSRKPGFIIVAQNAAEMAQYPEYVKNFDAVAQEEVWYRWAGDPDYANQPGDIKVDPDDTKELISNLELWRKQDKPIFNVEYANRFAPEAYALGNEHGFKTYVSLVRLDKLTDTPPNFTNSPEPKTANGALLPKVEAGYLKFLKKNTILRILFKLCFGLRFLKVFNFC